MNPFAEAYTQFLACATPLLISMFGALLFGVLAGWTLRPERVAVPPDMAAANLALEARAKNAEEKVAAQTTELARMRVRFTEEREQLERAIGAKEAEVRSMKEALVAAQRKPQAPGPVTEVVKVVPDPTHVARIANLERENARLTALEQETERLRRALVKKSVERIEAKKRTKEKERRKKTTARSAATDGSHLASATEAEFKAISTSFGRKIKRDDLQLVDGIGPKIKQQLEKNGYKTWGDVAAAKPEELKKALARAGDRYQAFDPTTWPEQARMMQENRWEELKKYQRKLSRSR